ncbi:MAG TPA: hypothetical protein VIQ24_24315 [Pyrinomonadaceae bacterium]
MSTRSLHSQAMEYAEAAEAANRAGDEAESLHLLELAYDYERQAAERIASKVNAEPTRSVLHRSAASLALRCGLLREAEQLIAVALSGNPPLEVAEELRDLLEQVYFRRHLDIRGIEMTPGQFQMSIAGNAIGAGWALSDAFVERVKSTEKLVYRTAERMLGIAFRERGSADKSIRENFSLFLSPLRVGSLAVTFKLGRQKHPVLPGLEEHMPADYSHNVIDEVMDCLELLNESNEDALKNRIPDPAYYHNFVGIARQIAPDGEDVRQVGFTVINGNKEKRVALRRVQEEIAPARQVRPVEFDPVLINNQERTSVKGQLLFADHRSDQGIIELIDYENPRTKYRIVVPEGMMTDIVRPLWEFTVVVTGVRVPNGILLETITQADEQ